jgi:hypothetical protein
LARSDFLVHWTGRDISVVAPLTEPARVAYVDRLFDILQFGFWMTRPTERVVGNNVRASSGAVSFEYHAEMTCFTEVRLSAATHHASQYGLVGIAVDRKFVLDRWGGPVHYVRNGPDEYVVGSFFQLRFLLQFLSNNTAGDVRDAAISALRDAEYLGVFLKPMSPPTTDSFRMLDEHEWRIVAKQQQIDRGNIIVASTPPPQFRLRIPPKEVRLLVLPDAPTRNKVLTDARIRPTLWDHGCYPPLLTLPECANL